MQVLCWLGAMAEPRRARIRAKEPSWGKAFRDSLGQENNGAVQFIYLVTFSRTLPGAGFQYRDLNTVSRQELASMVRDAFDDPIMSGMGGRPRNDRGGQPPVELVVVAKEAHSDGSPHFHAVVKLFSKNAFQGSEGNFDRTPQARQSLVLYPPAALVSLAVHSHPICQQATSGRGVVCLDPRWARVGHGREVAPALRGHRLAQAVRVQGIEGPG